MATLAQRSGVFTYDDFYAIIHEYEKGDLIDGVIYMTSPENIDANDLFGWLYTVIVHAPDRREGAGWPAM